MDKKFKKQINSVYAFNASNLNGSITKKFIVMVEREGCDRNGCPVYVASVIEDLQKGYYSYTSGWCYRLKSYEGEYGIARQAAMRCYNDKTDEIPVTCC